MSRIATTATQLIFCAGASGSTSLAGKKDLRAGRGIPSPRAKTIDSKRK